MNNRVGKIKDLKTIKGLRGDTLTIDLGKEYSGTLKAWFKKSLDSTTYRTFDIVDNRYLYLTAEKTSDYYNTENELQEAIAGKWYFDVELSDDPLTETKTIFTGTLFFVNDVTGSSGEEAVYLNQIGGYVSATEFEALEDRVEQNEIDILALQEATPTPQLRNFDITQWVTDLGATGITIPNNSTVDLFEYVSEADKTNINSGNSSELTVTEDALGKDFIKMNWQNIIEAIDIRIIFEIDQNGTDFFRVILRRKSDDSIVSVSPLSMSSNDMPENIALVQFITDIGEETDGYITDGFYLEFANNSGQSIDIINNMNIWINRKYQYPINL